MIEVKNKIVTLESLATLHAYNQDAYMPKTNNMLALVDLDEISNQYNPNDFVSFILEGTESNEEKSQQIIFTNKISNNTMFDVKAQAFQFDENGNMFLYELYFYLEDDKYTTKLSLTRIETLTGIKTISLLSYNKIYGIKIV